MGLVDPNTANVLTIGILPEDARPAAILTIFCSAIPTSKNLSGYFAANKFVNVDLFKSAPTTHKLGMIAPNSNIFFPAYSRVDPVSKLSPLNDY